MHCGSASVHRSKMVMDLLSIGDVNYSAAIVKHIVLGSRDPGYKKKEEHARNPQTCKHFKKHASVNALSYDFNTAYLLLAHLRIFQTRFCHTTPRKQFYAVVILTAGQAESVLKILKGVLLTHNNMIL